MTDSHHKIMVAKEARTIAKEVLRVKIIAEGGKISALTFEEHRGMVNTICKHDKAKIYSLAEKIVSLREEYANA